MFDVLKRCQRNDKSNHSVCVCVCVCVTRQIETNINFKNHTKIIAKIKPTYMLVCT